MAQQILQTGFGTTNHPRRMLSTMPIATTNLYKVSGTLVLHSKYYPNLILSAIYFKNRFGFLPPPARIEPLKETIECAGMANEYVDSAILDKYRPDFCTQVSANYNPGSRGSSAQKYAEGTPSEFNFELSWSNRATFSKDAVDQQCLDAIGRLTHNCDTTSRWKLGGYYTISSGVDAMYTYLVKSKRERPTPAPTVLPASCKLEYKFFYNSVWIRGGGWADDEERRNLLAENVRRCGVVTAWKFDWYEEGSSDGMEWEAYGRLPIGGRMWGCVRQAIVDSGGPGEVECK